MKKTIFVIFMFLMGATQAISQDYIPFVREGVKWVCNTGRCPLNHEPSKDYFTLELKGDVEINGIVYKAMHKYRGEEINLENDTVLVYLREQGKVVYGIVPDGKTYPEYPIGMNGGTDLLERIAAGEEFVLYDFNKPVEFIQNWIANPYQEQPVITDLTEIAGNKARRFMSHYKQNFGDFCLIEGIGYDGMWLWYPLGYCPSDGYSSNNLSHVIENGAVIYSSEQYNINRANGLMPLVREGVQWVNERVVINKGEITRSYYNYEFQGTNFRGYPLCYSYTDKTLDPEQATLAAVFMTDYNFPDDYIRTYNNVPFNQTYESGRDMIVYENYTQPVFRFAETGCDIEWNSPVNYYIRCQKEPFLSRQNFFEVDPVEIDGHECRRYAFVDEQGNVQAYLVEGIGFDSRDMGDLLTPFTRKPDPDADYQEYCGLSHVIKDGKIIYKGLRYREDVPEMPHGDVNGDGEVTIDDVTAMIDLLLSGGSPRYGANITISDVIDLIDMLLANGQAAN